MEMLNYKLNQISLWWDNSCHLKMLFRKDKHFWIVQDAKISRFINSQLVTCKIDVAKRTILFQKHFRRLL